MKNKVVKNVSVILLCSIIAKILSYLWEAILAAYLGASDQADAFYMTTSIFLVVFPVLDIGIWKVFLPMYKIKLVQETENSASRIANIAITLFFMLSICLIIGFLILAKPIVTAFAPGFSVEKRTVTVEYLRLCTPYLLFAAVSSVIGAMLQSHERFLGSQIREIGTHVARLACIVICYRRFGIYAAILAMIVGSIVRLIVQIPFINWNWRFRPSFDFKDKNIVTMIKGLPSVALTAAIAHLNGMIDKMFASGAASGAVACLNYGHKLMNVFSGMISTALATAVYPSIIQHIAKKENDKLRVLLSNILCALMFFIIPISVFCFLFSTEVVTAAFQRGAFDSTATNLTASVFVGYCIGMLFIGITTVITNVFYGYGDTKITMYISIVEITLNVIFDFLFVRFWGVAGLAVATSFSAIICLTIRILYLKKYITIGYRSTAIEGIKIIALSIIACIVPYVLVNKFIHMNVYLTLFLSAAVSVGIYLALAFVLHIKTLDFVRSLIGNRLGRKKNT